MRVSRLQPAALPTRRPRRPVRIVDEREAFSAIATAPSRSSGSCRSQKDIEVERRGGATAFGDFQSLLQRAQASFTVVDTR